MEDKEKQWLLSDDTGISSKVIWSVMTGNDPKIIVQGVLSTPRDPSDFGRCYRLLKEFPAWRFRLKELKSISNLWRVFVENYAELETLYLQEYKSEKCEKLYKRMSELGFN